MNENENSVSIETELEKTRSVTTDAGSITTISVSDAIKLAEYKKREQSEKRGRKRVSFGVARYKEF